MVAAAAMGVSIMALAGRPGASPPELPGEDAGRVARQVAAAGEPIPVTPLARSGPLGVTAAVHVEGTSDGRPMRGDLISQLARNDEGHQLIEITGGLLGDVVSRVGGAAVSLLGPRSVSVYSMPEGTYAVVTGLLELCIRSANLAQAEAIDEFSPLSLLALVTRSEVALGTLVGQESLDGLPVGRYLISGPAFLEAAQRSGVRQVRDFARTWRSAADADLWVATRGGHPVAYEGRFSGDFGPLGFDGELSLRIDLASGEGATAVAVPGSCDHAISL